MIFTKTTNTNQRRRPNEILHQTTQILLRNRLAYQKNACQPLAGMSASLMLPVKSGFTATSTPIERPS